MPAFSIPIEASLQMLSFGRILGQAGIAAAAVSSITARIGDGRSTLLEGVISALNREAELLGGEIGMKAIDLARLAAGK